MNARRWEHVPGVRYPEVVPEEVQESVDRAEYFSTEEVVALTGWLPRTARARMNQRGVRKVMVRSKNYRSAYWLKKEVLAMINVMNEEKFRNGGSGE